MLGICHYPTRTCRLSMLCVNVKVLSNLPRASMRNVLLGRVGRSEALITSGQVQLPAQESGPHS